MNLRQTPVRDIETANTDTPLRELARRMRESGIGFMPILEGDKLVGVTTDRDIAMRAVSESKDPEAAVARDVMSVEVVCCFEDETPEHARELMAEHNLRRLPVIDRDRRLVGIIRLADLEGESTSVKKALKVIFHKQKTDSYGRPHNVPIKTVYITGVKTREDAEAAAVKRVEEEHGTAWTNIADRIETTEEH
jgi:CBS domain-containing protein